MFDRDELETALASGYEGRGFELKGPGASDDRRFVAKIARTALSLGNLRDGGYIVVGIADDAPQEMLPGLSPDELASWLAYDDVARRLNEYADPPLVFDVREVALSTGVSVAVLRIHEFADIPHLCARDYDTTLRRGALYVRSRGVPETLEVASTVEMREVLDLAAEKRLRAYVETAERAHVRLATGEAPEVAEEDAREQFEAQAREAWDE